MKDNGISNQEIKELQNKTVEIEQRRQEQKLERLKRKKEKELKKRREFQAKLVAPVLLILTILISLLLSSL